MNVVYVITKADEIGGAQVHVRDLAHAMKKDNHNVTVIVGEDGALVKQLKAMGVQTIILPSLIRNISPLKDILCAYQLRKIINHIKPDIVTLHSSKAGIVGRLALIFSQIPVIFTAHGWAFAEGINERKRKTFIFIEWLFSYLVDKIITVSHQDKTLALKYKISSEDKQIVIHNGIPDFENNINNLSNSKTDNIIRIITVARFSEQKDHSTLLKSFSLLKNKNWNLTLVGKGPLLPSIKNLAEELKIADKVSFLGERHDVEELLKKSDIFILSSDWEGLPISIIEAMKQSLPVIASDVGGINELVQNNESGFLIKRKDYIHMKEKLEILIENESMRKEMGIQARKKYISDFTFNQMFTKTLNLYKSLIKAKK
ncbi:glycosyltransferase family 4 protein [Xenorhabdus bovienii]|uniref:glycosyltransferase family 4 protein n=1 Tax=Xenorhabdus bovienii TaxID=40576 RepID=UPI00237C97AF|nr:glycosyltransferase family 4 protein [Xenorhabdus bovienii]MDE1493765.1 glycosyltransferase family 4 protein [Xenorhabdus bovienii]MDE9471753.1 glycosyltransferase family 4 protein [Xenorhabdus bovienii]